MIRHQAKAKSIGYGINMFLIFLKKVSVVFI